ncbi:MAG: UTP--glucose-1-phosphate uridylyltransferase [Chlamydiae bacterium]|nr:UTP--glucose-1-phosphate uridylyltransferase [Chlamydiota bacterium]
MDHFYASIGGADGYHRKVMELMGAAPAARSKLSMPKTVSITEEATAAGLRAMPQLAEIYPIGGLGSRLDLRDSSGKLLPAAALPFCGRSLLEGLVRDVAAREYLYWKLHGEKVITPIALMASDEAHNFPAIRKLCEKANWFGRGEQNFRIFKQPSVPVITKEGEWLLEDDELVCQPNGHGALWKCALDNGIFEWFQERGRSKLLIRQINNPIAGLDNLLLGFVGTGVLQQKAFGFASCERPKGVQEGMLVEVEEGDKRRISNIEYTEVENPDPDFPTNTNILFADLPQILPLIQKQPLHGLMVNTKGGEHARLESMMQNISDALTTESTFVTFSPRGRTISSAKKKYEKGQSMEATPKGALYDLLRNNDELLNRCGFELPDFPSPEEFLLHGPSYEFYYNPALGPLYSIIERKLRGGRIARGSKLIIEDPEVYIENLDLNGCLEISGPCHLKNVRVSRDLTSPLLKSVA